MTVRRAAFQAAAEQSGSVEIARSLVRLYEATYSRPVLDVECGEIGPELIADSVGDTLQEMEATYRAMVSHL